ncbi:hypothetical protein CerSpe_273440 [Prunus speciosa]
MTMEVETMTGTQFGGALQLFLRTLYVQQLRVPDKWDAFIESYGYVWPFSAIVPPIVGSSTATAALLALGVAAPIGFGKQVLR